MRRILLAASCLIGLGTAAHAQAIGPGSFVPDPGLRARYLLNECVGSTATPATLADTTGRFPVTLPTSSPPVCDGSGGLSFAFGSTGYVAEPTGLQLPSGGTIEIAFSNAVTISGGAIFPQLFGYSGADPSVAVGLRPNYAGIGSQGFGSKWIAYQERDPNGNFLAQVGSLTTGAIDNGLQVVGVTWDTTGKVTDYLNGVPVPQYNASSAAWTPIVSTGGFWQWGGASAGTSACSVGYCGFGGKIEGVSFSATQATAATEAANALAWADLTKKKGATFSPFYGATSAQGILVGKGESTMAGHGLSDPTTAYAYTAAGYLGASAAAGGYGLTFQAEVDGNDNNTGYNIAGHCAADLHALASPGTGTRLALLMSHGNSAAAAGVTDGTQGIPAALGWPGVTTTQNAALQDAAELVRCARQASADGYIVAIAGSLSGTTVANDVKQKDAYNPIFRQAVLGSGVLFVDMANDPTIGADGAGTGGGGNGTTAQNNCVLDAGGSAVPTYQNDNLHISTCGNQKIGHQVAATFAIGINARNGAANPVISSATTVTQLINQTGMSFDLTAPGATFNALPVSGLAPGTLIATVINGGTSADTITLGTDYNGGPQNTLIDGATKTYSLPAGTTKRLVVGPVTDSTGIAPVLVL